MAVQVSRGLVARPFRVFNGGGIDTKTDPRLVPAGELVEIENMFYLKTGELRLRNGFTPTNLATIASTSRLLSIFKSQTGKLGAIGGTAAISDSMYEVDLPFFVGSFAINSTWGLYNPPNLVPTLAAVPSVGLTDNVDPDVATAGRFTMNAYTTAGGGAGARFTITTASGQPFNSSTISPAASPGWATPAGSRGRCAAGGSTYLCFFNIDTAGVPSLRCYTVNAGTGLAVSTNQLVSALNDVSAAQPWFDVKPVPFSNNILVAYRATGGGVTCLEFNPATGAVVTGPVNTAGADASMCLGWMDNQTGSGTYLLATAGAGAGVVVRTMSAALAVTATNVIDPTATANVNGVTGHLLTAPSTYRVIWDINATPSYNTMTKMASVVGGGGAGIGPFARGMGLLSRSFLLGQDYHVLTAYESATQSTTFIMRIPSSASGVILPVCELLNGNGGKRLVRNNCLTSVVTRSGSALGAISRQTRVVAANGTFTSNRAIVNITIPPSSAPVRPQEIGGTLFVPGGVLMQITADVQNVAVPPLYPEPVTAVGAIVGGGLMTAAGVYQYVTVGKFTDPAGRVCRTAPSVPTSVTLGGGDNAANLTLPTLRTNVGFLGREITLEVYRAGPAAAGATAFNLVGGIANDFNVDTVAYQDLMADTVAAGGELLYTSGGILENLPPPPSSLLAVNGNRVGVATGNEFWPSKEYKAGAGLGFNDRLKIRVDGDGYGDITAIAAMDGRWVLFKSTAIYIISGDGPNDQGQGSFSAPQAVSGAAVGTVIPGSVVATPDGIMFQAAQGIYLLNRGLGLTYVGKGVEQYTRAETVVDASLVQGTTQVRFVTPTGRCLVWDFDQKKWVTFALAVNSTVVACADLPGGWCYALANGTVMQEAGNVFSDTLAGGAATAIVPRVGLPALALAGINGYARLYGIDVLGEYVGDHTLAVDFEYDYSGVIAETRPRDVTAGAYQYEFMVAQQKVSAVKITLRTSVLAAGSGAFKLSGVTLWAGMKRGTGIPYTKRAP